MAERKRVDRRGYVLQVLQRQSAVTVSELCDALGLSDVSVRKLLDRMEKEGVLRRTWGGAVSAYGSTGEISYEEKMVRQLAQKQAIAREAYDMIKDGDAVYLDSGTTTLQLAQLIARGSKRKVLVCTHGLNIAMAFHTVEDIEVVLVGGALQHNILACGGGAAREVLQRMYFDKGFLSVSYFAPEQGFTTPNLREAEVKRVLMTNAKETIALADSSKYGNASLALVATCAEMKTLITDSFLPEDAQAALTEKGMRVCRAAVRC